jgi:hypothetical protein
MKKVLIIIGSVIGAIVIAVIIYLTWLGMFSNPSVSEKEMGPYSYVYDEFVGDYRATGPVFDKVYKALKATGAESTLGIGIYLDDPAQVPAERRRTQCGSFYELKDSLKVKMLASNLKLGMLDKQMFIVVEFPTKSSMSYMIGPMKCYPVLMKYAQDKGYGTSQPYEVYDMGNKMVYYIMAAKKQ